MPSPPCHAHRPRIGKGGQATFEHARVKLVGLAVDVYVASGKMGAHQGVAAPDHSDSKLIYEAILRPAKGRQVEPRRVKEGARVDAPAVRGIEQYWPAAFGRLKDFESRIEFVLRLGHGGWQTGSWRTLRQTPKRALPVGSLSRETRSCPWPSSAAFNIHLSFLSRAAGSPDIYLGSGLCKGC